MRVEQTPGLTCHVCGTPGRAGRLRCAACGESLGGFVGREPELETLRGGLEDALAGRGRLILLSGEPGIGKTRTAEQLAAHARSLGVRVLWGRCRDGGGAPPFWPWVQILRATFGEVIGPEAVDLAPIVGDLSAPPALPSEQARFRLFDGVATALRNAAQREPLVLVLDDLHAADRSSLLLLEFLAGGLAETRILLLGTYRDTEVRRHHPLSATLAELARSPHARRIVLRGLARPEVARLLALVSGADPPGRLVAAVHEHTEGNPFFVIELVPLLPANGGLGTPGAARWNLSVPQGVRDLVGRRLDRLSAECNRVLAVAAVIGRAFEARTLACAEVGAPELLAAVLEEAADARVIVEVPRAVGRYAFAHALIREVLYDEVPPGRRVLLHRQIADQLDGIGGGAAAAEVAHHCLQAALAGGDVARAVIASRRAGDHALSRLAYDEAAEHYERALEALGLDPSIDDDARCELLLALGEARRSAGAVHASRATFLAAAEVARQLGSGARLACAALGYGGEWFAAGHADGTLIALLDEALAALPEGYGPLRAQTLARLASELYFVAARRERMAELSEEALAVAQRLGDAITLAHALNARHFALWEPAHVEERLDLATEIARLGESSGDPRIALQGHYLRLIDLMELGDIARVHAALEAHARLARELHQPLYRWQSTMWTATVQLLEGHFAEAERLAEEALVLGERAQEPNAVHCYGLQMLGLRREQGRLAELAPAIEAFGVQYGAIPGWRAAFAYVCMELGRDEEARRHFDESAADDFAALPRDMAWLVSMTVLVETCVALGDARRARVLYDLLVPYAGRAVPASTCYGAVARSLGLLATTMQRWDEAERHFEAALELNGRMGARPWVAWSQHGLASMLLARSGPGDAERARRLLTSAAESAAALGMRVLADRVSARAARLPATDAGTPGRRAIFRKEGEC